MFVSWRGDLRLELVNPDGSNRRSLLDSGAGLWDPTWSPDGQRILFYISDGYFDWCFGLWTVNADGSDARQLGGRAVGRPFDSGNDCFSGVGVTLSDASQPAWSPDGSEIAFRGEPRLDIEVARADGSGRRLLVAGPAHYPDWTPDGRLIYTKGSFDGPMRIFISDGGTERQLIPDATAPVTSVVPRQPGRVAEVGATAASWCAGCGGYFLSKEKSAHRHAGAGPRHRPAIGGIRSDKAASVDGTRPQSGLSTTGARRNTTRDCIASRRTL